MESNNEGSPQKPGQLTRREFIKGAAAVGAAAVLEKTLGPAEATASPQKVKTPENTQRVEGLNGEPLEDREKSILDELKVPAVVAGAGFAGGAVTSAGIDAYMKKPIDRRTMVKTGLFTGFIAGVVGLATKFGLNPSGSSEFMDKHPMRREINSSED